MNLREMEWRTRSLVGVDESAARFTPVDTREAVNDAYMDIVEAQDWSWLRSEQTVDTVADEPRVTVDPPLQAVHGVQRDDGFVLAPRDWIEHRRHGDRDPAKPREYARVDPDTVELWPIPDGVYTLTIAGSMVPAPLVEPTDEPLFDGQYHRAVPLQAAAMLLGRFPDDGAQVLVERLETQAAQVVESMRRRYQLAQDPQMVQMSQGRSRLDPRLGPWRRRGVR